MDAPRPRRLGGRLLAGAAVLALLVLGAFHGITALQWAEMGRAAEALRDEEIARPSARVLLRPALAEGDPWEAYSKAKALVATPDASIYEYTRKGSVPSAGVRRLLSAQSAALAELARGARLDGKPDGERERELQIPSLPTGYWADLAGFAACDAILKSDAGSADAAVDRLLDLLQLARDLGETETHPSAMLPCFLWVRRSLERSAPLERWGEAERERLESAFTKLIDSPSSQEAMFRRKLARVGRTLHAMELSGWRRERGFAPEKYPPEWRHGGSDRRLAMSVFATGARLIADAEGSDGWTWERRRAVREAAGLSPLERVLLDPDETDKMFTLVRLQVLLARSALRWTRTGRFEAEPDPWGRPLRHLEEEGARTIWSVGRDASDEYGASAFHRLRFAR